MYRPNMGIKLVANGYQVWDFTQGGCGMGTHKLSTYSSGKRIFDTIPKLVRHLRHMERKREIDISIRYSNATQLRVNVNAKRYCLTNNGVEVDKRYSINELINILGEKL